MQLNHLKIFKQLYFQILIAISLGILLGYFHPKLAIEMKPLGDGFIKLIRMIVTPVIFLTVVTGISKMTSMKEAGKIGVKALIYFEIVTTFALIIGLTVAKINQPGVGLNINPASLNTQAISQYATQAHEFSWTTFLLNIIPESFLTALVKGDILPVLFIALLVGFGMVQLGERTKMLANIFDQLSEVIFSIINFIMKLAPIGAFGGMAFTIGAYGFDTLFSLGKLMLDVYITCLLFVFLVLGSIAKLNHFSIWKFLKYIKEELVLVLGTSSSEVALPRMLTKLEKMGCDKSVVGLVLPAGYSFNLDGTCIYLTMAVMFIAHALNINLTFEQELTIILVLLLTSKGAAAVTGGGFVVLAATLSSLHIIPVEGIVLLLGVDRFMSEARALTNLIGNGVATVVIARWESKLDEVAAKQALIN